MTSLSDFLQRREQTGACGSSFWTASLLRRLKKEATLQGHNGCVNRMDWNSDGTLLATTGDDLTIHLWKFPVEREVEVPHLILETDHRHNIFGLKFLPHSCSLVTGAMDGTVQYHAVTEELLISGSSFRYKPATTVYSLHSGRVKHIETSPDEPYLCWSCAEDGTVRQWDVRTPESAQHANVVVNWGDNAELRSLAINKVATEQMAVVGNKPYANIYDRRKFGFTRADGDGNVNGGGGGGGGGGTSSPALQLYLPADILKMEGTAHSATHCTFGETGTKLLVNFSTSGVYSFDVVGATDSSAFLDSEYLSIEKIEQLDLTRGPPVLRGSQRPLRYGNVPRAVLDARENAHLPGYSFLSRENYKPGDVSTESTLAVIENCSKGLQLSPLDDRLLSQRSLALTLRGWPGDAFLALRDLEIVNKSFQSFWSFELHTCSHACNLALTAEYAQVMYDSLCKDRPDGGRLSYEEFEEKWAKIMASSHRGEVSGSNNGKNRRALEVVRKLDELYVEAIMSCVRAESDHATPSLWSAFESTRRCLNCFQGMGNFLTDIKEAVFMGENDSFVAAGSDCGHVFIFDADTGECLNMIQADSQISNCLRPHPIQPVLAVSGIDSAVSLWSPLDDVSSTHKLQIYKQMKRNKEEEMIRGQGIGRHIHISNEEMALLSTILENSGGFLGEQSPGSGETREIPECRQI